VAAWLSAPKIERRKISREGKSLGREGVSGWRESGDS